MWPGRVPAPGLRECPHCPRTTGIKPDRLMRVHSLVEGGPTLDWSVIQPLFFGAESDVIFFLDCCYAGQAARGHVPQSIEFLAATDKDQMTPTGGHKWPSFTKVLIREMEIMLQQGGDITLPRLARQMGRAEVGLRRQPYYVPLTDMDTAGSIRLPRLTSLPGLQSSQSQITPAVSLGIQLSLFEPLDLGTAAALIKWMTKNSPTYISNVELITNTLAESAGVQELGHGLVHNSHEDRAHNSPALSSEAQTQLEQRMDSLRSALSRPSATSLTDTEAIGIINDVKQRAQDLGEFVADLLPSFNKVALDSIKASDACKLSDLKDRISMQLLLVSEDTVVDSTRVDFTTPAEAGQRHRLGKKQGIPVLTEYYYPDMKNKQGTLLTRTQVARVSALHREPKSEKFRTLSGLGFVFEPLQSDRFGLIYELPPERVGCAFCPLSELIAKVPRVPLEIRAGLAASLTDALLHLHSVGWYHKGIKSANVLVFSTRPGAKSQGSNQHTYWDFENPYLMGFDCSRPSEAETRSTVDFSTANNIYRHPDRWGRSPRFERYHDLYSLGIILTEIACWRTLPEMDIQRSNFEHIQNPEDLREILLIAAGGKVKHAVGTRYAQGISVCLEKRRWNEYQDWQFQRLVREEVLRPLQVLGGLRDN